MLVNFSGLTDNKTYRVSPNWVFYYSVMHNSFSFFEASNFPTSIGA